MEDRTYDLVTIWFWGSCLDGTVSQKKNGTARYGGELTSARAPPPPWSRSQSRRPSPALEAAGPGQTDFLLLWRTASCGAAGCGLLATGELAGVAGTSLPPRVPTTLPRTGGNSGRPGAERRAGAREMRSRRGGAIGATAPVPGREDHISFEDADHRILEAAHIPVGGGGHLEAHKDWRTPVPHHPALLQVEGILVPEPSPRRVVLEDLKAAFMGSRHWSDGWGLL
ncbi:hypothetical protein ACRRTK_011104 [Alexandromys fortis]